MAYIKLPYGEIVEVSAEKAEGIKQAMMDEKQRDRLVDLGTRTIKLGQVKEVDTAEVSKKPGEKEEKYDIYRDRDFLTKFGNEVEMQSKGEWPYQFEKYCEAKGLTLIGTMDEDGNYRFGPVNLERHGEYTDVCERLAALKKLRDLTMSLEERQAGIDYLREQLKEKMILKSTAIATRV